ncbi:hypothetical protein ABPG75_005614 [Micractinium tetrahymenae]
MLAARRDNVRELFGGAPPSPTVRGASPAKLQQQEYAAQLREQIAAREAARQQERAHSLRQSAALLELRQAAPSAVLPGAGAGASSGREPSLAPQPHPPQQGLGFGLAGPPPPLPPQQQQQPGWDSLPSSQQHRQQQQQQMWGPMQPADTSMAPAGPMPGPVAPAWDPADSRAWQHGHVADGGWAQPHPAVVMSVQPLHAPHAALGGSLQPPFGVDHHLPEATWPPSGPWNPAAVHALFGTDVLPAQGSPPRPRSLQRMSSGSAGAFTAGPGHAAPPWAFPADGGDGPAPAVQAGLMAPGPGWLAALSGAGPDGQADAREAAERKRAAYKAELERQMVDKAERKRQEQAAEQAAEVRKAAEAEQLRRRAASGVYGGGSGPLRGADGRPITDLNQVRRWQMAAAQAKPEAPPSLPPAQQTAIPAHWGPAQAAAPAAEGGGWQEARPAGGMLPPLSRQPSGLGNWQDAGGSASLMATQQLQRLPSGPGGWLDPPLVQHHVAPGPAEFREYPQPVTLHGQEQPVAQLPTHLPPPGWPGDPAVSQPEHPFGTNSGAPPPALPSPSRQPSGTLALPSMGGGAEAPRMRLRSDRPYQTASEAERRARAQAEFQAALRAQMEEKTRLKAEEQRRQREEEAAEEARLERERERMRQQFDADQARHKAKQAAKEASGAETLESGGITIKFKPPPAGRRGAQQAQQQPAEAPAPRPRAAAARDEGMVGHDDVVPGIEIRVKGPPRRREPSNEGPMPPAAQQQQQEQAGPRALQPQPSGGWPEAEQESGEEAEAAGSQDALAAGSRTASQQPLQEGQPAGRPGAPYMPQPPWQQPMPGMHMFGVPPPPAHTMPPWQQAAVWGPPMPPGPYPLGGGHPGWVSPPPFHQPNQHLSAPPYLLQPLGPPQWGQPPPWTSAPWGSDPAAQPSLPPPWQQQQQQQQQRSPPQGQGSSAPGPGPPWHAAPGHYAVRPPPMPLPLPQGHYQQHLNLQGPPSGVAAHPPPMQLGRGGVPVWETRSVLSMRDSIHDSRPPTSRAAAPLQLGSLGGGGGGPPSARRPSLLARDSLGETSMPGRSSTVFPPQPPLPAELVQQVVAPAPAHHEAPGMPTGDGRRSDAGGSSGRGSMYPQPPRESNPLEQPAQFAGASAPLAAGLSTWAMLKDGPPSRRTTATPPPALPPLPQSRKGSGRRRSSWAGLFGLGGGAAELLPNGAWPS